MPEVNLKSLQGLTLKRLKNIQLTVVFDKMFIFV